MSIKEVQYEERRNRILSYCSQENNTISRQVLSNHMMFNKDAGIMGSWALEYTDGYLFSYPQLIRCSKSLISGVSMCYIPKVASSTWIAHFANIQDGKAAFTKNTLLIFHL